MKNVDLRNLVALRKRLNNVRAKINKVRSNQEYDKLIDEEQYIINEIQIEAERIVVDFSYEKEFYEKIVVPQRLKEGGKFYTYSYFRELENK